MLVFVGLLIGCERKNTPSTPDPLSQHDSLVKNTEPTKYSIEFDLEQANRLAELPLKCMEIVYPNKLNQTLASAADLQAPDSLHPAFYGCFDWHSAVHGHWSLVRLLRQFPKLDKADSIRAKLARRITPQNIEKEIEYFKKPYNSSFERTYGWAWLLKLAEELHNWDDSLARSLEHNLYPLTQLIVHNYTVFLPKLIYPIRVGTHTNTAFGLSFAYDYACSVGNTELQQIIAQRAKDYYYKDSNAPLSWEPSGYDFLSPCMEQIDILRKILPQKEFLSWLAKFLPQLANDDFSWQPGAVSDRSDGHLVHLDGLNFSRAWCLYGLAKQFASYGHLRKIADKHVQYSLKSVADDNYEGEHWLASFALYALGSK
jgi:hypothetical protein